MNRIPPSHPQKGKAGVIPLVLILIVACLCLTATGAGVGFLILKPNLPWIPTAIVDPLPNTATPQTLHQTEEIENPPPIEPGKQTPTSEEGSAGGISPGGSIGQSPTKTPQPTLPANTTTSDAAFETLWTLQSEIIPINNPIELAERMEAKSNIPLTLPDPNAPYRIGDTQTFWVTNVDTNTNFQITASLRYLGDHVYIWIENGVDYDESDLVSLGDEFDEHIYPTNREFFGSEWSPGVDDDPHIYIVYAGGLGYSLAGYFSSADQVHPDAHEYSNAHEMFLINSDNVYLWEDYIYGTLAHEFQHMIHWYTDLNEETWLNEGFSMLSELLNGYDPGGFDFYYIMNPDLQLTDWGSDVGSNGPYYGAAQLFTTYLLGRFGDEVTKAVVAHDENGMHSIDLVLDAMNITDPLTGVQITAEDVFVDWTVANYLGDSSVEDGRYYYNIYPAAPVASPGKTFSACPSGLETTTVHQFGVDYIKISCDGTFTLDFNGNTEVPIVPAEPYSGDYFFWSNMGDESNMSLERAFNLTGANGEITLTYQTWYDLEEDYDYVFVTASTDGLNWEILDSTSCTTEDPSGNSYGCGLNGKTHGWQEEAVDLSPYAGQEVTIRFDYITDAAVNGIGLFLDDIRVDAIGYFTDFEADDGGWLSDGFVRIQNSLPQKFRLTLITFGSETLVTPIVLDAYNQASVLIDLGGDIKSAVLVVSGTTPYTRQKAEYQFEIH